MVAVDWVALQTVLIGSQTAIFFVAAIASIAQLRSLANANRADHLRRAQQSTFEFLNGVLQQMRDLACQVPMESAQDIAAFIAAAHNVDGPEYRTYSDYFNLFEYLAAGVNTGVFDFETIFVVSASRIRRTWETYADLIQWDRTRSDGWPQYLIEMEALVGRIMGETSRRGLAFASPAEAAVPASS